MDQPYSFAADLLNKFHTAPDWIQALWLIAPFLTVLGMAYLAAQVLREALRAPRPERPQPEGEPGELKGHLLYGIYETAQGELMLYVRGKTEKLGPEEPPPRLKLLQ